MMDTAYNSPLGEDWSIAEVEEYILNLERLVFDMIDGGAPSFEDLGPRFDRLFEESY